MKKYLFLIIVLLVITVSLEIVHLSFANKVAAESLQAGTMVEKITQFEEENSMLESKILQYTAFEEVASRAAQLGFVESKSHISLYEDLPIAMIR